MPRACSSRLPAAGPDAAPLKASVVRAVARMEGGAIALDAPTTAALQTLLDDPGDDGRGAADRGEVGQGRRADGEGRQLRCSGMLRELGDAASERRRAGSTAPAACSRVPARRAEALSAIAPMLSDAAAPAALKGRLDRRARRDRRRRCRMPC